MGRYIAVTPDKGEFLWTNKNSRIAQKTEKIISDLLNHCLAA